VWTGSKLFSLLEVETGGLDQPVCASAHVCTDSKLFFLLEVETGGLALPVCTSAHVCTVSKLFFLLEVGTGGLDLPVCTSAHVYWLLDVLSVGSGNWWPGSACLCLCSCADWFSPYQNLRHGWWRKVFYANIQ
jgi:hypothetical protein